MKREDIGLTLADSHFIEEKKYWLEKLSGLEEKSRFFYDFSPKYGKSKSYGRVDYRFTGQSFDRLMELSKGFDSALHIILTAALVTLLGKYTGSKDIIIGTPVYKQEDVEEGFVNTVLALRNFVEDSMTFKEMLSRVKQTIVEAVENQNYPVERIIQQLNMPSSGDDFPLFDVTLLFENIHDKRYLPSINPNVIFSFSKTAECVTGMVEYNSALYKRTTMERIVSHYMNLLEEVLFNVNLRLSEVNILSLDEKQRLLVDFNGAKEQYPGVETIHEIFREQVEKTPHGIAVKYKHTQLSYRELNRVSDRLAHILRKKGVNRDKMVGLMIDRSPEMIAGLLGILKAGGAYLPLDSEYPRERIKYMLEDGAVRLLLTNDEIEPGQPGNGQSSYMPGVVEIINIRDENKYPGESRNPGCVNKSTDLVYVIYTSGSTGKPKGVMLGHRNLVNLLKYQFKHTNINCSDVLQFTTISFDVSFQEIFSALLSGGTLHLVDKDTRNDIAELFEVVAKNRIKTLFLPASFLKFIFNEEQYAALIPPVVKHIVTAGEQVIVNHRFRRFLTETNTCLHNHYGPAETHVVTALTLEPAGEIPGLPPIGMPVSNTGIYILDRQNHLLPVGVPGELYIGGIQVGRGYVNNPEMTNDRFLTAENNSDSLIPYPLYRTGDLAHWLPDGNIQFLGRIDYQVKIRGFRVEPGEIESRLLNHEDIRETAVSVLENNSGEKYLCAYFVSDGELPQHQLREYLSEDLPDYMIPSFFVQLQEIPLTGTGKVDRKALPEPVIHKDETIIPPGNEIEKVMVELWAEVLGIEKANISIDANFFDLGGHSLRATILITKIHKTFNVRISLAELFASPTIASLAKCIKKAGYDRHASIEPTEEREYYPLSSAQKRLYTLHHMETESTYYNSSMVVLLVGKLERKKMETVLRKLIERHESFRTSFEMIGNEPFQEIHKEVDFEVAYYDNVPEEEEPKIIEGFMKPFDITRPPLLRVGLLQKSEDKHVFMIEMHHIITDGTSLILFGKEFQALYAGEDLPLLKLQYKDYSEWHNKLMASEEMKKQENYWLKQLEGEIPILNFPTDFPMTPVQNPNGDMIFFGIEGDLYEKIKRLVSETGTTVFIVFLSAYNILLSKLSEQEDIVVGTPIAGRTHSDLQNIMGFFVNMLVMRNQPKEDKTYNEFLMEVKENAVKAYENQDYQFEILVEKLHFKREPGRHALIDAIILMQNQIEPAYEDNIYNIHLEDKNGNEESRLELREYESILKKAPFTLCIDGVETEKKILMRLVYATGLFKRTTAVKLTELYIEILEQAAADRETPLLLRDIEISGDFLAAEPKIPANMEFGF